MKFVYVIITVLLLGNLFSLNSSAMIKEELTYSEETLWRCAVRFIRVDSGFEILEKERGTGYMLFVYKDGNASGKGALEMIRVENADRRYVRVQITVNGQPKYIESMLLNRFKRKLRREYGFAPEAGYIEPAVEQADDERFTGKNSDESTDTSDESAEEKASHER